MYKIITPAGDTILTEKVNYIRVHKNGVTFLRTDRARAEGVAHCGTPYLFKDGAQCYEFDGADEIRRLNAENESMQAHLAETDEVAIDLYEASLNQEAINAEQDEAIIEIYEMMEGA